MRPTTCAGPVRTSLLGQAVNVAGTKRAAFQIAELNTNSG